MLLTFLSLVILWIFSRCQLSLLRRRQLMLIAKIMDSGGKLLLLLSRFSHVWLCDPIDGSPPGSPVPGTLQARTLEWVAISFSNAGKWKVKVKSLSRIRFLVTPWTAAHQAPLSIGFSRQEYWSGVPLPSPWHCTRAWKNKDEWDMASDPKKLKVWWEPKQYRLL